MGKCGTHSRLLTFALTFTKMVESKQFKIIEELDS